MDYGEIIKMAEANLEAKGLKNYLLRAGPETDFVGRFNLEYFQAFRLQVQNDRLRGGVCRGYLV